MLRGVSDELGALKANSRYGRPEGEQPCDLAVCPSRVDEKFSEYSQFSGVLGNEQMLNSDLCLRGAKDRQSRAAARITP